MVDKFQNFHHDFILSLQDTVEPDPSKKRNHISTSAQQHSPSQSRSDAVLAGESQVTLDGGVCFNVIHNALQVEE